MSLFDRLVPAPGRRLGTVGLLFPLRVNEAHRTAYLDLLLHDLTRALAEVGLDILLVDSLGPSGEPPDLDRLVRQRKADGFLWVLGQVDLDQARRLHRQGHCVIVLHAKPRSAGREAVEDLPCFFTDHRSGGSLAAQHLLDRGCRRMLCLADQGNSPEMADRTEGFLEAAGRSSATVTVVRSPTSYAEAYAAAQGLASKKERPDGIFCHTDIMALATLRAFQEAGVRVPQDLKVVGYDDLDLGTYGATALTTVHQPREELARLAAADLVQRLGQKGLAPVHQGVVPWLVVRGST